MMSFLIKRSDRKQIKQGDEIKNKLECLHGGGGRGLKMVLKGLSEEELIFELSPRGAAMGGAGRMFQKEGKLQTE